MKKRKLTLKQRKWIKKYIETGNATEAAMQVYDCKNRDVARNIGTQNVAKLSFSELMDEMGLSDVTLLDVGKEGLKASKPISALVLATTDKDGVMRTKGNEGMIEVPDYAVRHKYWDTMLKLKNKFPSAVVQQTQVNVFGNATKNSNEFIEGEEV